MPPWPHPLYNIGYRLARIEQPVGVEGGEVCADLVLTAEERNAALVVECKEGTVQHQQATRYEQMTAVDLVQTGNVTLPNPNEALLGLAYAVAPEHVESTLMGLAKYAPAAGVLEVGSELKWHGPPPVDPALRQMLSAPISTDLEAVPRLLLVDEATPAQDLAGPIANALHGAIVQGRDSVTISSLIEMACWGWPNFGRGFQGKLSRDVQKMLKDAASRELSGIVSVEGARNQSYATVRIHGSATATTQAGELRAQRALRGKLESFVLRVSGRPANEYPGQLRLEVSDDDFEDDLSDD